MIRNPKDFGVWSACPSGVHSVITRLEMLPKGKEEERGERIEQGEFQRNMPGIIPSGQIMIYGLYD